MKKVLFILGDFWPTNSGGTIRVAKLIKYLPSHNWEGLVLTRKLKGNTKEEKINGTLIFRTNAFDLGLWYQKVKSVFIKNRSLPEKNQTAPAVNNQRIADKLFVPDINILWALGAVLSLRRIIKSQGIDCIYSTSPLSSSHMTPLVYSFLFKNNIKWVVEFRDPWTFNPFREKKPNFLEKFDHHLEKLVIKRCDTVVVTSTDYKKQFLKKYPFLDPHKINFVPNGYDSEDFTALNKKKPNDKIKIVHTGNFYGKRSIKPFLEALYLIIEQRPEYRDKLEFEQVGIIDSSGEIFNNLYQNSLVILNPTIPHHQSLQKTVDADWLLLIPGPGSGTMPGKLYEYLATGNPIIALVDEGPAKTMIEELGVGYIAETADVNAIKNILIQILQGNEKYTAYNPLSDEITKFDRKNIALQVSSILDKNDKI